jgi:hypothetical protein
MSSRLRVNGLESLKRFASSASINLGAKAMRKPISSSTCFG